MDRAVQFYRDTLKLPLKFQSSEWSEFATGETTLALHPASSKNTAGTVQLGFNVPDIVSFYADGMTNGIIFTQAPTPEGQSIITRFLDSEGAECSLSGQ